MLTMITTLSVRKAKKPPLFPFLDKKGKLRLQFLHASTFYSLAYTDIDIE